MTDVSAFAPATQMLQALRRRRISAAELLELHLRRVEAFNPRLNAIVTPDYENARRTAAAADSVRRQEAEDKDEDLVQGRRLSPSLRGLPLTIKDSIDVRGLPTTAGLPERADACAEADAPLVARVRAAGAVIMGKTNVPPLTGDWQTNNRLFGRTNNPWDLDRTPGGSTGGGAAALAAGLTPLEFGSDIGGSIRIPAAFCGVYGHKPSETALPRSGHFPGTPFPNAVETMMVQGPLARSAADLEVAFAVTAGPEVGEDVAWRLVVPPPRHTRLADYRVALLPAISWLPVDAEIMEALEALATQLSRAGAKVAEAQPEGFGDLRHHTRLYFSLLTVFTFADRPEPIRRRFAEQMRARDDEFADARIQGLEAGAADYLHWHRQREAYRAAYRSFFRDWDVLLTPVTIVPAFPHTDAPWAERKLEVNGRQVLYELLAVYPALATLSGQPATAFPVGLSRAGLPIGLQVIGPYLEDHTAIRFAYLIEQEFGGFRPPPGYA